MTANVFGIALQFVADDRFEEVKEFVRSGAFGGNKYDELLGALEGNEGFGQGDYFLVGKDFPSYIECQEKVDDAYRNQKVSSVANRVISRSASSRHSHIFYILAEMDKDVDIEYSRLVQVQQRQDNS